MLCKVCGKINVEKQKKKPIVLILVLMALFVTVIGGVAYFLMATDPIEEMRASLEEIDSTSYVDIINWIDNELPEFENRLEDFDVTVRSLSAEGRLIQEHFLDRPSRFIEWQFILDEDSLEIDLTYLTLEEYVSKQLSQLDRSSFSEITRWIEEKEDDREINVQTLFKDTDGNTVYFFEGWDNFLLHWNYELRATSRRAEVSIEFTFNLRVEITLGETFEFLGTEFTFVDEILGYRLDYSGMEDLERAYFSLPVLLENVSDEPINTSDIIFRIYDPSGRGMERIVPLDDGIFFVRLEPGETKEGSLHMIYRGEGEYVVGLSDSLKNSPVTFQVIIPVHDIYIPDRIDGENMPLPDVVYDLQEGDLALVNHDLSPDSFFYTTSHVSELGHTYMLLRPGDIVRDPEGVITHDSLRMGYNMDVINWADWEDGFDAVTVAEWGVDNLREGGSLIEVMHVRASEDRSMALLHIRQGGDGDNSTIVIAVQLLPCGEEFVILGSWLWTIDEGSLVGERRAAIEEFGRLTGIDYIAILRGY